MSFTRLGVAATRPPQFLERGERVAVTLAPLGSHRPLAVLSSPRGGVPKTPPSPVGL